MVALAGAGGRLHLAQQRVHLLAREPAACAQTTATPVPYWPRQVRSALRSVTEPWSERVSVPAGVPFVMEQDSFFATARA